MCIIASVPEGLVIDESILRRMWYNNSDGGGFMYAEDNKLHVTKGLMTFDEFMQAYEPHAGKKMVIHFRIKTHGAVDGVNTHPFNVTNNLAFAHNGTISGYGSATHSDTWHFNEELIKPLYGSVKSFLKVKPIQQLLADKIGWSKLVFMDNKGTVTIINESRGDMSADGIWFSNTGWRAPKEVTPVKKYHSSKWNKYEDRNLCLLPPSEPTNDGVIVTHSTPSRGSATSSAADLQLGDFVWVTDNYKAGATEASRGEMGYVNWFTSGYLVAVSLSKEPERTVYIPRDKVDKCRFARCTHRVGHLQPGDYVLIELKDGVSWCVYDPDKDRSYTIHSDYLEDMTDDPNFSAIAVPWLEDFWEGYILSPEDAL